MGIDEACHVDKSHSAKEGEQPPDEKKKVRMRGFVATYRLLVNQGSSRYSNSA